MAAIVLSKAPYMKKAGRLRKMLTDSGEAQILNVPYISSCQVSYFMPEADFSSLCHLSFQAVECTPPPPPCSLWWFFIRRQRSM